MSPRKPAALRDGDGENLRDYLIATAARLIGERGSAGIGVRDIAREARVSDGVLYNYFEDKEDLLAHALLAHVGTVMTSRPRMPPAGTGTVADNLRLFIDMGLDALARVVPAFAGLLSRPKVLMRFHAMVGGDAAFAGEAVYEHRLAADPQEYAAALLGPTGIEWLLLDDGFPPPDESFSPEEMGTAAGCRVRPVMRLERVAEEALTRPLDELRAHVRSAVAGARAAGFAGLKTIAAYRTGLDVGLPGEAAAEQGLRAGGSRLSSKPLL